MSKIEREDYSTKDVMTPIDNVCRVYVDYYWWCEYGDPKRAVMFRKTRPQCNKYKKVLEHLGAPYKGCEIVQIPVAYLEWKSV